MRLSCAAHGDGGGLGSKGCLTFSTGLQMTAGGSVVLPMKPVACSTRDSGKSTATREEMVAR